MGFEGNGGPFNLFQLKVTAEVISITVFTIIALFIFRGRNCNGTIWQPFYVS